VSDVASRRLVPFAYGFRPFFLLAGIYAALSIAAWMWLFGGGAAPGVPMPPQFWHGHEMIFGFVAAAIAGFMLTAVPSWTGERGFGGAPLIALTGLWVLGRIAFGLTAKLPFAVLAMAELAFLPGVMLLIAPSLFRSRNRNMRLLVLLLALWTMDAGFLYGVATGDFATSSAALRGALDLVLILVTVIGGRIVPSFTGNALRQCGQAAPIRSRPWIEKLLIAAMLAYAIADLFAPAGVPTAVIAATAAVLHAWRLSGWRGLRTVSQPIVFILHVAYLWLPIGLALKAASLLGGFGWAAHWQHALGAGAAASMILAVMTRAALGHTGRPLRVHPLTTTAYGLLTMAVIVRVFVTTLPAVNYRDAVLIAGTLWLLAFLLYAVVYLPILVTARVDGKEG